MCKSQFPFESGKAKTMFFLFTWLWIITFLMRYLWIFSFKNLIPLYDLPPQYWGKKEVIFFALKKH
jgi:hypothetical protein